MQGKIQSMQVEFDNLTEECSLTKREVEYLKVEAAKEDKLPEALILKENELSKAFALNLVLRKSIEESTALVVFRDAEI